MGVRAIPFLSLMPKRFLDLAQDFVLNITFKDHPGVEHGVEAICSFCVFEIIDLSVEQMGKTKTPCHLLG